MRIVWTLVKVIIGLAIAIPLAIFVFATSLGVLGVLIGLAFLALKLAVLAVLGIVAFRLLSRLLRSTPEPTRPALAPPAAVDHHYEAAMRELDAALGERPRS
jgi:hypothetical protein